MVKYCDTVAGLLVKTSIHANPCMYVKIFKTEITLEIQLVRPTEVCGKVLSEENCYKFVKTALLLSNVLNADHQNSCLFTNKGHFPSPLWVLIGVLAIFHE